jgi:hypothetical protein
MRSGKNQPQIDTNVELALFSDLGSCRVRRIVGSAKVEFCRYLFPLWIPFSGYLKCWLRSYLVEIEE